MRSGEKFVSVLQDAQQEDRRLCILGMLLESSRYMANDRVLRATLEQLGHSVTAARVRADLSWLEDVGLISIRVTDGLLVTALREEGEEVARGIRQMPGVAQFDTETVMRPEPITGAKFRHEFSRWLILLVLNDSRPNGNTDQNILAIMRNEFFDFTLADLRKEIDYLRSRSLVDVKPPVVQSEPWQCALTRHGTDIVEYTIPVEPGIARPDKS
ncbi:MAG: hypothetical protein LBI92_06710 [Azoarcus sp.]|jgi:hypothetical protein|nr:hypothetical protein [Azoarcus sp.]